MPQFAYGSIVHNSIGTAPQAPNDRMQVVSANTEPVAKPSTPTVRQTPTQLPLVRKRQFPQTIVDAARNKWHEPAGRPPK